jgi:flagellin-like protein
MFQVSRTVRARFRPRSRKAGISEIVGSLLLLLVIVSLSATIFAFATTGFGNLGSGFSSLFSSSGNALSERVVIEQVTFNESGSKLGANIYVRNVGGIPSTVAAIYVNNVTAGGLVLSDQISPQTQMNVGTFRNFAVTFTPDKGSVYSFTIATTLGNTVIVNEKA